MRPELLHKFNDVTGFYEKVGENAFYIDHSEEIIATYFSRFVLGWKEWLGEKLYQKIEEKLISNKL